MKRVCGAILLFFSVLGFASAARAQWLSDVDITVSPRVWFRTDNSGSTISSRLANFSRPFQLTPQSTPNGTAFTTNLQNAKSLDFPMFGLSVGVDPRGFEMFGMPTDFVITAFGGSGQTSIFRAQVVPFNQFLSVQSGFIQTGEAFERTDHAERVDVEALARSSLTPAVKLLYGLRFIYQHDEFNDFDLTFGTPAAFAFGSTNVSKFSLTQATPMIEAGVQFTTPISADGTHSLFAGGTLGLGYTLVSSCSVCGGQPSYPTGLIDTNVGYQYAFSSQLSALVRYRFQALGYFRSGSFLDENLQVIHGPEVGVTVRF